MSDITQLPIEGDVLTFDSSTGSWSVPPCPAWPNCVVAGWFAPPPSTADSSAHPSAGKAAWSASAATASSGFDPQTGLAVASYESPVALTGALPVPFLPSSPDRHIRIILEGEGLVLQHAYVNAVDATSTTLQCSRSSSSSLKRTVFLVPASPSPIHHVDVVLCASGTLSAVLLEHVNLGSVPNVVFLLTGQSNSLGVGGTHNPTEPRDAPHPRVMGYNFVQGAGWQQARLDDWSLGSKPPGLQCLGFHFAKYVADRFPDAVVGLVVVGEGGQSISRWAAAFGNPDLYYLSANVCRAALQHSHAASLAGILWHQGQADMGIDVDSYSVYLHQVVAQYRNEKICSKNTAFISGELPGKAHSAHVSRQTEAHRRLDRDADPMTASVRAGDLPTSDLWHFSTEGHRELGKRYFVEYARLLRGTFQSR